MALPEKCPLCHAGVMTQTVVTPHVFGSKAERRSAFFHCQSCDVRYQYPGLNSEEEAHFYTAEFESFMTSRAGAVGGWHKAEEHIAANEQTRQRRMKYLTPHLFKGASILEVGCSSGFMLHPLVHAGYPCTGVEPSGVFGEYIKSQGVPVHNSLSQLHASNPDAQFDIVLHFFVLEHIADPLSFLQTQLNFLKPGGKIIFEIPNAADPLYAVYDIPAFERFYWSVAHPWYFSERSLQYLLEKLNQPFEMLRDQRYDLSNHMVWARDGRPGGMGRFTTKLGKEFEENYKRALIEIGMCDTLIGIVNKR